MALPFDTLGPLEAQMHACVHCGFCLSTCPSYIVLGQEMDSPRGRIYTMRAGLEGRTTLSPSVVQHFDTCLGCMACETACPSGVKYAPLIEKTRALVETHHRRPIGERLFRALLFAVLPYPSRLRLLIAPARMAAWAKRFPRLVDWLPARMRAMVALAPPAPAAPTKPLAEITPAVGARRLRVGLLTGCVQRVFFGPVNDATARVLAAEGCEVVAPSAQGCCGALALHAGEDSAARAFARRLIETFEGARVDLVAVNAAGCGSAMKEYGQLLADDPGWAERARRFSAAVRDVTEVLTSVEPRAPRHPLPLRVAYHDACHLAHAQGVRQPPRTLLGAIPGVTLVPIGEGDVCCGSAGLFNLLQPDMATTLGDRKARHLADAHADILVTSNPGCLLQLRAAGARAGHTTRILHIVEVLDRSIRGLSI